MDRYFASQPVISNGYMAAGPGGMMGVPTQPAYTTSTAQVQFSRQYSAAFETFSHQWLLDAYNRMVIYRS